MKKKKKNAAKAALRRAWNELSRKLRREIPFCQKCGKTEHLQVHHLMPKKLYPQLLLDERNLVVLCPRCHSFCAGSAHKDGMAFAVWLMNALPEKFRFCAGISDIRQSE